MKIKASVIIPVRTITPYVKETVSFLKKQSEKDFEIIIVTDKKEELAGAKVIPSGEPIPSFKRNLGTQKAKGSILAFLDDDSYPDKNWLKNALKVFSENKNYVGVCGPTLTPPKDNVYQKASGWVWASWYGSGGAGVYRNKVLPKRTVDDFPSVNLLVRKRDFMQVGGFDTNHWPGEDTKLCLDLTKTSKKIVYDPSVLVYHHRRAVFLPHLKQISRYALRRGYFARVFPETSFRLGYFIPSFFAYGLIISGIFSFFLYPVKFLLLLFLAVYCLLLIISALEVLLKEKNLYLTVLVAISIFLTHFIYGLLFLKGCLQRKIKTVPRKIDSKRKTYVGG